MAAISVINKDLPLATLLGELLRERGQDTVTCCDAQNAYDLLKRETCDLIVLDLDTRKPDEGWNTLTFLQLHPTLRHVPVIVCSGPTDELLAKKDWLQERAIRVVTKPFDLEDLYREVDALLKRRS